MNRVAFKTFGCRLNQAESADMRSALIAAGYRIVSIDSPCDAIVIHSCTITDNAEKEALRLCRSLKTSRPDVVVAIVGCAVEANPDKLKSVSGADILLGQKDKYRLPELLFSTETPNKEVRYAPRIPDFNTTRAIVKIQDGCDFRCTYCIVPDARGQPRNRDRHEILDEIRALAEQDFKEIVLTGANLACYSTPKHHLTDLLSQIEAIPGVPRIRLSSIELSRSEKPIIDFMADSRRLCRYLHFPLQSGDDRILAAMHRRYTSAQYRALIDYALEQIPFLGLGSDILVGFPGEDETAFQNTASLLRALPFSNLHVFPYSKRPGTPAAMMPNQVDRKIKKKRVNDLISLGEDKKRAFAGRFVGREVSVLVEQLLEDGSGKGWTSEYVEARVPQPLATVNTIAAFTPSTVNNGRLSVAPGA